MQSHMTNLRVLTIFISSPFDVAEERHRANEVVLELQTMFQGYGVIPTPWQYQVGTIPGLGADAQDVVNRSLPENYDVYVGIMCNRLGTPTHRATSGTLEEFAEAKKRFFRTGKPHVFFYFCENQAVSDKTNQPQANAVQQFIASFPGLYTTYASSDDFKEKLRLHLTQVLLSDAFDSGPASSRQLPVERSWASALYHRLQSGLDTSAYPLCAADRVSYSLNQLFLLAESNRSIDAFDQDLLICCAYLKALRDSKLAEQPADFASLDDIPQGLLNAGWDLLGAIADSAEAAEETDGRPSERQILPALLALGDRLSLDTLSMPRLRSARGSIGLDQIDVWLAFLTEKIDVARNGLVTFHLRCPDIDLIEPLKGATAYRLEIFFQQNRRLLHNAGVTLSVAPCVVSLPPSMDPIPDRVVQQIQTLSADCRSQITPALHLGANPDESASPGPAHVFLPVPESVIRDSFTVYLDTDRVAHKHRIEILDRDDNLLVTRDVTPGASGKVDLDVSMLTPGESYAWYIHWDDGSGFGYDELYSGRFQRIDKADAAAIDMLAPRSNSQAIAMFSRLGLTQDLLQSLWSVAFSQTAGQEYRLQLHGLLSSLLGQMEKAWPTSPRLELVRNSINLLWTQLTGERAKG